MCVGRRGRGEGKVDGEMDEGWGWRAGEKEGCCLRVFLHAAMCLASITEELYLARVLQESLCMVWSIHHFCISLAVLA